MWSDEEIKRGMQAGIEAAEPYAALQDLTPELVAAIMSRAVELAAARGGLLTAEQIASLWRRLEHDGRLDNVSTRQCLDALAHQGTTVATLQEKLRGASENEAKALEMAASLQAKVEELETSTSRWEFENTEMRRQMTALKDERDTLRAEVERLKAENVDLTGSRRRWKERAEAAESRLAAIRAKVVLLLTRIAGVTRAHVGEGFPEGPVVFEREIAALVRKARVALEGDASQDGKTHHIRGCPLSPAAHVPAPDGTACECARIRRDVACLAAPVSRYPCSPTCTHDDAATPGHPERVKERSEAVSRIVQSGEEQEAEGYEQGVEDMRKACLEALQSACHTHGVMWFYQHAKQALEGAAP